MWRCLFKRADPAFRLSSLNLLRSARTISRHQSKEEPSPRPWAWTRVRSSTASPFWSDLISGAPDAFPVNAGHACLWWRRCLWLLFFEIQLLKPVRSGVSEEIIFLRKTFTTMLVDLYVTHILGYLNTRMIVKLSGKWGVNKNIHLRGIQISCIVFHCKRISLIIYETVF